MALSRPPPQGGTAPRVRVFGLTGGFGSGKSTVAARFRERGLPVIDADALARDVVAPGTPGLSEIRLRFGADVLRGVELDRKALAERVFSDPEARAALNAITHPLIQAERARLLGELGAAGEPLVAYEVPLLYENQLEAELAPVVVVDAPEASQVERAMQRSALTEAEVRARLAAQLPLAHKLRRADYVIDNAGNLEHTLAQADVVLRAICQRLGVDPARYFGQDLERDLRGR